jgi:hypothetical protein
MPLLPAIADDGKLFTTIPVERKADLWVPVTAFDFGGPLVTISLGSFFVVAATQGVW